MARISVQLDQAQLAQFRAQMLLLTQKKRASIEVLISRYADLIVARAQSNAPVRTDRMRRAIRSELNGLVADIKLQKGGARHGHLVEFGTSAHAISARRKPMLRFRSGGKLVSATRVMHPGTRAKPFLIPAFLDYRDQFIKELTQLLEG